jgi:hypothetical protein
METKIKHTMAVISFVCALACLMVFVLTNYTLAALSLFICMMLAIIYRAEYQYGMIMEKLEGK